MADRKPQASPPAPPAARPSPETLPEPQLPGRQVRTVEMLTFGGRPGDPGAAAGERGHLDRLALDTTTRSPTRSP